MNADSLRPGDRELRPPGESVTPRRSDPTSMIVTPSATLLPERKS